MSKSNASWIKNTSIVTGASIVEYAFGLIAGILVARSLGPSEFGRVFFRDSSWTIHQCAPEVSP
jgi:O-antigen/teichoic acid export membrane protein